MRFCIAYVFIVIIALIKINSISSRSNVQISLVLMLLIHHIVS